MVERTDPDIEIDTLLAHSVKTKTKGKILRDPHWQFRYVSDDKLVYSSQHGRNKCSKRKCSTLQDVPHNCLFHPQWLLPQGSSFADRIAKQPFVIVRNILDLNPIVINLKYFKGKLGEKEVNKK